MIVWKNLKPITSLRRTVRSDVIFMEEPQPVSFRYLTQIDYPPHIIGNTPEGECRIYRDIFNGYPKAMYREKSESEAELIFYKACPEEWKVTLDDLNYMAIERQMLQADAMILHSSFVVVNGSAVLFTAPSGTGKSTQADLWERYAGATIMNGDRTLLIKTPGRWRAAGFPFSGSSGIFHNGVFPIKALIMIHQAVENEGERVSCLVAFKRSYPEIVRNYWNVKYEDRVVELLEDLLPTISRIKLGCNMEEDAVRCLEGILRGEQR